MRWKILLAAAIAFGAYQHLRQGPADNPAQAGVVIREAPAQQPVNQARPLEKAGYRIVPLAEFALQARVLGAEHYRFGREADLSPVDLALGWGPMSDTKTLRQISISQGSRFYYWRVREFPIPRAAIETSSANMHMIPASRSVEKTLERIRPGQLVSLRGYLVEVSAPDGWHWRSSLSRSDTGNGACELVWVEALEIL